MSAYGSFSQGRPLNNLILIVLGLGVLYFIVKIIKDAIASGAEGEFADDLATQQATELRIAMQGAGTNEDAIYKIGYSIIDFNEVAKAYSKLYDRSLVSDLTDELDSEEMAKFRSIISGSGEKKKEREETKKVINKIEKEKYIPVIDIITQAAQHLVKVSPNFRVKENSYGYESPSKSAKKVGKLDPNFTFTAVDYYIFKSPSGGYKDSKTGERYDAWIKARYTSAQTGNLTKYLWVPMISVKTK